MLLYHKVLNVIEFWSGIFAEWANYFSDRQASSTWFASVFSRGFNRVFSRVDTYVCAVNVCGTFLRRVTILIGLI
jgi:hypothetical protein